MHSVFRFAVLAAGLLIGIGTQANPAPPSTIHIIPQPVSVTERSGHFTLGSTTSIVAEGDSLRKTADWLAGELHLQQGKGGKQRIILKISSGKDKGEGYTLSVTPSAIRIESETAAGIFYGTQTLLQLTPLSGDA